MAVSATCTEAKQANAYQQRIRYEFIFGEKKIHGGGLRSFSAGTFPQLTVGENFTLLVDPQSPTSAWVPLPEDDARPWLLLALILFAASLLVQFLFG